MEQNPRFLKEKYPDLHTKPDVILANKIVRNDDKVSQKPEQLIQGFLDRYSTALKEKDDEKRKRHIEALKRLLHVNFVIKFDEIPDSYWQFQQRLARERGHGDVEITEQQKRELGEIVITDQKSSLDKWVKYLLSSDATYPDWLKYWTVRNVLTMGDFDKTKKAFSKRTKGTVKPFPDLNREALAYVLDAVKKKYEKADLDLERLSDDDKAEFSKILRDENFAKLYGFAIERITHTSEELLKETRGEWIKYPQGSDHMSLVKSLQGHGTGWCTAGESTAEAQLKAGDFYVYYSLDQKSNPTIPRAAIRMEQDNIAEVRGIAEEQNLDPYIAPVVQEKMKYFSDGSQYEKKASDMKRLTEVERKVKRKLELDKNELRFIWELEDKIEGFGYERDPRIDEIRSERDRKSDLMNIFDAIPEEVAETQDQVTKATKVFLGTFKISDDTELPSSLRYAEDAELNTSLTNRIAHFLLQLGRKDKISLYIGHKQVSEVLDSEIADAFLNEGSVYYIATNFGQFRDLNPDTVIEKLVQSESGDFVMHGLWLIKSLDKVKIAERLIDLGKGRDVAKNIEKLEVSDYPHIAERLIQANEDAALAESLWKFKNLDPWIAAHLRKKGFTEAVRKSRKAFVVSDERE